MACSGFALVHPGILVPDVGHLKQILVEAGLAQIVLEEGFVGPGAARSHHHPVELMLLDHLAHGRKAVGGAGEGVVVGIDHARQGEGKLAHLGHVDHSGDVDAAVAHEDADARLLGGDLPFLRIGRLGQEGAPDLAQEGGRRPRRRRGLAHGFGDVLGRLEDAAGIDALPAGLHHLEGRIVHEAPLVGIDAADGRQLLGRRMGRQAHGQDHHIELFHLDLAVFVHVSEFQVMGAGIFRHPGDHGADEAHPVFVPGPLVVAVKTLALGPEVDEEDGGRQPRGRAPWR